MQEPATNDGGYTQYVSKPVIETIHTRKDQPLDGVGNPNLLNRAIKSPSFGPVNENLHLFQGTDDFLNEKWVALGFLLHETIKGGRDIACQHRLLDQLCGLELVKG